MSNTVLYCRTANSGEDIQEQQLYFLTRYSQRMGYAPVVAYCDWNTSGVTLDRPMMNKLIVEVRTGVVRRIVVKDLSRLARDFLLTEKLFNLLREYDVEIVSVNDGGIIDLAEAKKLSDALWALAKEANV